jgi:hypothetical protein
MLAHAEALLTNTEDHPTFAEIKYEKARMAFAEGAADERTLLQAARDAAARSGYFMLLAIVDARLFWHFQSFDLTRWMDLDAGLSVYHSTYPMFRYRKTFGRVGDESREGIS